MVMVKGSTDSNHSSNTEEPAMASFAAGRGSHGEPESSAPEPSADEPSAQRAAADEPSAPGAAIEEPSAPGATDPGPSDHETSADEVSDSGAVEPNDSANVVLEATTGRPTGGSGEWLQQFAWALEDGKIEDAATLLPWIIKHAEAWASAQAGDLVVEQLNAVSPGKGYAARLIRIYHILAPEFPREHDIHGVFTELLNLHVKTLGHSRQALKTADAILRVLELFQSSLEMHSSYHTLSSALQHILRRSQLDEQREKEERLQKLRARARYREALELCNELIETYRSPLAMELLPALMAQEGVMPTTRQTIPVKADSPRDRSWDWPDQASSNIRSSGSASGSPETATSPLPDAPWSRTFDAPPMALRPHDTEVSPDTEEAVSVTATPLANSMAEELEDDPFAIRRGQMAPEPPAELHDLDQLQELGQTPNRAPNEYDAEQAWAAASSAFEAISKTEDEETPGFEMVSRPMRTLADRRLVGLLIVAVLGLVWWYTTGQPSVFIPTGNNHIPMVEQTGAKSVQEQVAKKVIFHPLLPPPAPTPPMTPNGPPAKLTLSMTPSDLLEVYLNGILMYEANLRTLEVPSGQHKLEVYRENYEKYEKVFEIAPNTHKKVKVRLKRSPTLLVEVNPSRGIELWLNDKMLTTRSPLDRFTIPPGKHKVEVSSPGYLPYSEEFTVEPGQSKELRIALKVR